MPWSNCRASSLAAAESSQSVTGALQAGALLQRAGELLARLGVVPVEQVDPAQRVPVGGVAGGVALQLDGTLEEGLSVHVVAATASGDCGEITNTATVTTTNGGSDQSSALVDVNCAA